MAATTKSITESASVKQESGAVTGCVYDYLVFYPLPLLLTKNEHIPVKFYVNFMNKGNAF